MINATVKILQSFAGITVGEFKCHSSCGSRSGIEYAANYTLIFLLKGSFRNEAFKSSAFVTSELILFKKPGFEYEIFHEHYIHDECIFINLRQSVIDNLLPELATPVRAFLMNQDQPTLLLKNDLWRGYCLRQLVDSGNNEKEPLKDQTLITNLIYATLCDDHLNKFCSNGKPLPDSVDKAKHFIFRNFKETLTIESIAGSAHLSPYHFCRVFKQSTQISPYQYLLQLRLKYACNLLLNTNSTVTFVAYESGFSSVDHFVTLFKEKVGITPTDYRDSKSASNRKLRLLF